MNRSPWQLYVFRETHRRLAADRLVAPLLDDARAGRVADALVRAGEIESALADAADPDARAAATLTDALAASLVGVSVFGADRVERLARSLAGGRELRVVPPESFSYYALHPSDFADRVASPPLAGMRRVAVVGLRSIGTTLSAVLCAAFRARGASADRRTVRPRGEPYRRTLRFDASEERWVRRHAASGSEFVVVDEGPGLSGSTLLSVADALAAAGVPAARITVVCTRAPDASKLLAPDAARRWGPLRVAVVSCAPRWPEGFTPMACGAWRGRFLGAAARWPGCWAWLERAKAMSDDGGRLLKFEGLGRHGADALDRAGRVAEAGFGPAVRRAADGRLAYDVVAGRALPLSRLDERIVDRLADYCAWRARSVPAGGSQAAASAAALEEMARANGEVALGVGLRVDLEVAVPTIADAHMMPHEWIDDGAGALWKTDAASHGDDHVFPGPVDAAWDLAGAIVEWRMPRGAVDRLLARYARRTGDRPEGRLGGWLLAYALHGLAWTELAAAGVDEADEKRRLEHDACTRRRWLRAAAGLGWLGPAGASLRSAA